VNLADVQKPRPDVRISSRTVRLDGTSFLPESRDRLAGLPIAIEALALVEKSGSGHVSLDGVYSHFVQVALRTGHRGQQMVITALVADRYIEFVTKSGNRIKSPPRSICRSIWDDIVGIAKPIESARPPRS
jgi:hypothetical protein